MNKLSVFLKGKRYLHNMSQTEFSKYLGLSKSYISLLEQDKFIPSPRAITKMALKLKISCETLMELQNQDILDRNQELINDYQIHPTTKKHQDLLKIINKLVRIKPNEEDYTKAVLSYCWIQDDSMFPFKKGWLLECNDMDTIKDGDLIVVRDLFRKINFYRLDDNKRLIVLYPLNNQYESEILNEGELGDCKKVVKIHLSENGELTNDPNKVF